MTPYTITVAMIARLSDEYAGMVTNHAKRSAMSLGAQP